MSLVHSQQSLKQLSVSLFTACIIELVTDTRATNTTAGASIVSMGSDIHLISVYKQRFQIGQERVPIPAAQGNAIRQVHPKSAVRCP